jgi:hypothetical protein
MDNKLCIKHSEDLIRVETKIDTLIDSNDKVFKLLKTVIESDIVERTNNNAFFYKIIIAVISVISSISMGAFGINQIMKIFN